MKTQLPRMETLRIALRGHILKSMSFRAKGDLRHYRDHASAASDVAKAIARRTKQDAVAILFAEGLAILNEGMSA